MRGMHHIRVDRTDGLPAYQAAVRALHGGEVVGVFPEATISRSFTLKKFKSGAARMAAEAQAPLLPMVLWGTQRLWTKGRPKNLTRRHTPISVHIGAPIQVAEGDEPEAVTRRLHQVMADLLDRAQQNYPDQPAGSDDRWWLPAHLGGAAPTPEAAQAEDMREIRARIAARRAQRTAR
jgi:1-acyl-sn-glycerol-3-phosphate acyltransferase